jgi:hypothetical protein
MSKPTPFRHGLLNVARALYVLVTVAVVLLAISSLGLGMH